MTNGEPHLAVDLSGEVATTNFDPERFLEALGSSPYMSILPRYVGR